MIKFKYALIFLLFSYSCKSNFEKNDTDKFEEDRAYQNKLKEDSTEWRRLRDEADLNLEKLEAESIERARVKASKEMPVPFYISDSASVAAFWERNSKNKPTEIIYEGTVTESGFSQNYTLYIKSDFSSAAIGGGPYTRIQDQGDGTYMWLDGAIIGMSFKPMNEMCTLYGNDGSYFCTLFRK